MMRNDALDGQNAAPVGQCWDAAMFHLIHRVPTIPSTGYPLTMEGWRMFARRKLDESNATFHVIHWLHLGYDALHSLFAIYLHKFDPGFLMFPPCHRPPSDTLGVTVP